MSKTTQRPEQMGEVKRYECFTEWGGTNYDATLTDDGPWVSYDDHAEEIATLRAKLRIFLRRRDSECEEGDDLRAENERLLDEAYNARQSAKGENALRLGAEDDHAKEVASLRAQLEEACNFVVDSECSCLPYASPEHGGMCERCVWLEGRDDG